MSARPARPGAIPARELSCVLSRCHPLAPAARLPHFASPPPGIAPPGGPEAPPSSGLAWSLPRNLPLARVMPTYQPPGLPSRSGLTTTDTLSPGLMEVRFQPSCTRLFGPFISIAQVSTLPLASVTSTLNEECGLDQLNSVTTPVIFTTRVRSNIAPE